MLADDLLHQAYHLAAVDPAKPKQANLRRAISAAYYALFHRLIWDCAHRMSPKAPPHLSLRMTRAFVHVEMKQVCRSIVAGNPSEAVQELQPDGFSNQLRNVARIFVVMQEARHQADYDLAKIYSRTETVKLLNEVKIASAQWSAIRSRPEANVFLAALLFAGRWSK